MLKHIIFVLSEAYYELVTSQNLIPQDEVRLHGAFIHLFCQNSFSVSALGETGQDQYQTLWITDIPALLLKMQTAGFYAIALYHDGNRGCSFSGARYAVEDISQLEYRSYEEAYRRLAGLPWDILETERLFVRESQTEDIPDFYRIYQEPAITAYTEPLFEDPAAETAYLKDYINQIYGFYGFGIWTVLLKKTGQIIGRAGLNLREGYELPELGFVIDVSYQHQGLGYEVCSAILNYAKEELQFERVQAFVLEANLPSRHLLEKLGFSFQRPAREKSHDYLLYAIDL